MSDDAVVLPDGWLGSPEWYRDTRGRGYEFELPTGQIVEAIHVVADALGDDFDLLAYRLVEGPDGRWFDTFEVQPVSALEFAGSWRYFIRSKKLTPILPPSELSGRVRWDALFATNGLIRLDHPSMARRASKASRIGLVNRVYNREVGEVIEHTGYDEIFRKLKRELTKRVKANQ